MPDNPNWITDARGNVAMRYLYLVPKRIDLPGKTISFSIQNNITLAWVRPDDVNAVLAARAGCCGQKKAGVFTLASQGEVNKWFGK